MKRQMDSYNLKENRFLATVLVVLHITVTAAGTMKRPLCIVMARTLKSVQKEIHEWSLRD